MQLKKHIALLLVAAMILSVIGPLDFGTDTIYADNNDISTTASAVEAVVNKVYEKGVISDWYVADMAADGCVSDEMLSYVENMDKDVRLVTDAERLLIVQGAVGIKDEALADYICSNIDGMAVNQLIFGLLALDSLGYDRPEARQQLIDGILASQNDMGGFGAATLIDTDVTALAVLALAPYEQYRAEVERGVNALAQMQGEGGAFYNRYGAENSNSTSVAINALCAAGVDIFSDSRFIKSGNALEGLLSFMNDEYTFGFTNTNHNALATEQAFRAMVSVKRQLLGEERVYIFRFGGNPQLPEDTTITTETSTTETTTEVFTEVTTEATTVPLQTTENTTTITTEPTTECTTLAQPTTQPHRPSGGGGGSNTKRLDIRFTLSTLEEPNYSFDFTDTVMVYAGSSVWDAVKTALDNHGLVYDTSGDENSIYLSGVGESASNMLYEFDMGVNSGWMYSVNGSEPDISMGGYKLTDGDIIQLYYVCDYTKGSSDSSYDDMSAATAQEKFDPVKAFTDLTRKRLAVIITYVQK